MLVAFSCFEGFVLLMRNFALLERVLYSAVDSVRGIRLNFLYVSCYLGFLS